MYFGEPGDTEFGSAFAIWVNSSDVPWTQQRFTLAHEVGHLLLGHVSEILVEPSTDAADAVERAPRPRKAKETNANAFASGALSDYETLDREWDRDPSPAGVARLAASLGMSFSAMVNALRDHFPAFRGDLPDPSVTPVRHAYDSAGLPDTYYWFESLRNQKRLSPLISRSEILARVLEHHLG